MRTTRTLIAATALLAASACGGAPTPPAVGQDDPAQAPAPAEDRSRRSAPSSAAGSGLVGDWERLGPDGFLELRLGMTRQEAAATGRIQVGDGADGCTGFYLAMYGDGGGSGPHGYFSDAGLAVLHARGGAHTPEGVEFGTSVDRLRRTYPALRRSDGYWLAPASDEADYFFTVEDGVVRAFGLASSGDSCLAATGPLG